MNELKRSDEIISCLSVYYKPHLVRVDYLRKVFKTIGEDLSK